MSSGIVRGLAKFREIEAEEARRKEELNNKAVWFKLKSDGDTAMVRFLQELDEDSKNYSSKNDLGFVAIEHSNPDDYRRKALCTFDEEGACVGEEMHKKSRETNKDYRGQWGQKRRFYINVLVKYDKESDPVVAVLSQGTGAKSIFPALLEAAEEDGSITDRWFKITRKGSGFNDTSYLIYPKDKDEETNVEDYDVFDLSKVIWHVPYEKQLEHYGLLAERDEGGADVPSVASDSKTPNIDDEW